MKQMMLYWHTINRNTYIICTLKIQIGSKSINWDIGWHVNCSHCPSLCSSPALFMMDCLRFVTNLRTHTHTHALAIWKLWAVSPYRSLPCRHALYALRCKASETDALSSRMFSLPALGSRINAMELRALSAPMKNALPASQPASQHASQQAYSGSVSFDCSKCVDVFRLYGLRIFPSSLFFSFYLLLLLIDFQFTSDKLAVSYSFIRNSAFEFNWIVENEKKEKGIKPVDGMWIPFRNWVYSIQEHWRISRRKRKVIDFP